MSHSNLHPNTRRFLDIMNRLDYKKWWRYHPKEDFGQAVRRMSEKDGNIEGDYPSDAAIKIALQLVQKYERRE